MKHIVFDIETIPQDEAKLLALAPEFTAPANLKDPAKIEAAIAKKRADYLADAALNWKTAEVVLIGAGDVARVFGLPPKLGHGGDFPLLWRADRDGAIAYNRRDVEIEIEIARICGCI